jgi:hypothetical protein
VELKEVFKEDAGLELNVSKTSILPKGVTQQVALDVVQGIITTTNPALTHLSADLALARFCPEVFVGIGVPICTDIFVRDFVPKHVSFWCVFATEQKRRGPRVENVTLKLCVPVR